MADEITHFQQYATRSWGLVHTKSNHEKIVQTYFENNGLPCYLPTLMKRRSRNRKAYLPMFRGYLFGAWGINDYAAVGRCSSIANSIHFDIGQDDDIVAQMKMLCRIELLSEHCKVDLRSTKPEPKNEKIIIKTGVLAGCAGCWKNIDGKKYFAMPITFLDSVLEVTIDEKSLREEL